MKVTMKTSGRIMIVIFVIFLTLTLYFSPLSLLQEKNEDRDKAEQLFINLYPKFEQFLSQLKHQNDYDKSPKLCPQMDDILKEITNLRSCQKENKIYKIIQDISQKFKGDEILHSIQNLNTTKYKLLNSIENIQNSSLENELKYILGFKDEKQGEDETIFKKLTNFREESWTQFEIVRSKLNALEFTKNLVLNSNLAPQGFIDIQDFKQFKRQKNKTRPIFFTETSTTGIMKARFVCAVESAAKAYPESEIILVFSSLPPEGLPIAVNEALNSVLKHYKNVQIFKLDLNTLLLDSPLEDFGGKLEDSKFKESHTSDVLRFYLVWLYGGFYFDLDIIIMKPLKMERFVVYESAKPGFGFISGAFGMDANDEVLNNTFDILTRNFDGQVWAQNGPFVITEAMKKYTGAESGTAMNETSLKGIVKLPYQSLFPIEFDELKLYFDQFKSEEALARIYNSSQLWGVHIGNNIISNEKVWIGAKQAYGILAQKYCPRSYWSCYDEF